MKEQETTPQRIGPNPDFRPGIYVHYKGGRYRAITLVNHHETRKRMVVYTSFEHESLNVREYESQSGVDAWNDEVLHNGFWVPRFTYVSP